MELHNQVQRRGSTWFESQVNHTHTPVLIDYVQLLEEQLEQLLKSSSDVFTLNSGSLFLYGQTTSFCANDTENSGDIDVDVNGNVNVRNVSEFNHPALVLYMDSIESKRKFVDSYILLNSTVHALFHGEDSRDLLHNNRMEISRSSRIWDHYNITRSSSKDDFQNSNIVVAFVLVGVCAGTWMILLLMIILSSAGYKIQKGFVTSTSGGTISGGGSSGRSGSSGSRSRSRSRIGFLYFIRKHIAELTRHVLETTFKINRFFKAIYNVCCFNTSSTYGHSGAFSLYTWFGAFVFTAVLVKANKDVFHKQYYNNYQDSSEFSSIIKRSVWFRVLFFLLDVIRIFNWLEIVYYLKFKMVPNNSRTFKKKIVLVTGLFLTLVNIAAYTSYMFIKPNSRVTFLFLRSTTLVTFLAFVSLGIIPFAINHYKHISILNSYDADSDANDTSDVRLSKEGNTNRKFRFYKQNLPLIVYSVLMILLVIALHITFLIKQYQENNWLGILIEFSHIIVTLNVWVFIGLLENQEKTFVKDSIMGKKIFDFDFDLDSDKDKDKDKNSRNRTVEIPDHEFMNISQWAKVKSIGHLKRGRDKLTLYSTPMYQHAKKYKNKILDESLLSSSKEKEEKVALQKIMHKTKTDDDSVDSRESVSGAPATLGHLTSSDPVGFSSSGRTATHVEQEHEIIMANIDDQKSISSDETILFRTNSI